MRQEVVAAVNAAEWPEGAGSFTIYPESGKKSGKGNGVVPIKRKPMAMLQAMGWELECPWDVSVKEGADGKKIKGSRPGDIDAAKSCASGLVVVEWETGNVSSSHRSLNKIALGLVQKKCVAGILVVPSGKLAPFLTDRIGNIDELRPYFPMWKALKVDEGVLELLVIEHDAESKSVPRIPKGTDGRAEEGAKKRNAAKGNL